MKTSKKTTLPQNNKRNKDKKTTLHLLYICSRYKVVFCLFSAIIPQQGSFLAYFYHCLISVPFASTSLPEAKRKVSAKLHFKQGWACYKQRNGAEMKTHKKNMPYYKIDGRKEKQEDYPIYQEVRQYFLVIGMGANGRRT